MSLDSASLPSPCSRPLREFFSLVFRPRKIGRSPRTLDEYHDAVTIAERYFAQQLAATGQPERAMLLSDLTDDFVALGMEQRLADGHQSPTANKFRRKLVAIVNFARRQKRLPLESICIPPLPEPRRTARAWMEEELQAILTAAGQEPGRIGHVRADLWFSALILFVVNTGCRITSVMRTPRACLDLERGTVIVPAEHQKHRADEPFPLTDECLDCLRYLHRDCLPGFEPETIFGDWRFDPNKSSRTAWPTLNARLRGIIVRAGLRDSTAEVTDKDLWHKFRKTMASYVAARMGPEAAQMLLGHSSPAVTALYLDDRIVKRPDVREALPKLNRVSPMRIVG